MSEQLPSIDDFIEELPPVDEVITEENLPSIDEFIEKEEEDIVEETIEEPVSEETAGDLTEILHLINAVRRDIPQIPEIKYYDEPLEKLSAYVEQIKESIPEVKYYDHEVEAICEQIDLVREEIKDLPEVKYYDEQVTNIEDRIDLLRQEVVNLPEVKYYDKEIEAICEAIDNVRAEIPKFPKWVNEVNEVPDFSWIGKTFSVIDEDFVEVGDKIKDMASKFDADIHDLTESLDTKDFEQRVQIDEVKEDIKKTKEKIFEELKEAAIRIWDHHTQFKDDDRKLKKQVLSKLNETKQNIEKQILDFNVKNYEDNKTLTKYFEGLKEEIGNLPEVKYYDTPIKNLKTDLSNLEEKREEQSINIAELYKIVGELKETQQELKEVYNDRPIGPDPELKQGQDPLTPTDQKFATLQDLAANYRLFVNRVEQQLYTIGGGGAGFLKDLDDVNISGLVDGDTIIWNSSTSQWDVGTAAVGAGGTWASDSVGVSTTKNVGIATTARSDYNLYVGSGTTTDTVAYFDGHISVAGSIFSREVVNIDSIGIVTAGKGFRATTGGIIVTAGVSTFSGNGVGDVTIGAGNTSLLVDGDARVTGILTVGSGSVTIDPSKKEITGVDNVLVGSGASISLAPLLNLGGTYQVDYSKLILSASGSTFDGTYERQSSGYYLAGGAVGSGGARFYQDDSSYYYFLHESDNSKIVIFSIVEGIWILIYKGGSDFSSITNGQSLGYVTTYQYLTSAREYYSDNTRVYPGTRNGVEYLTSLSEQTSSLGIATASSLDVAGIVTASQMVISGTTGAFYPPVLNTTERDALTVTQGAMIFNTTDSKIQFYDGSTWQSLPGMSLGLTVALDG